MSCILITIRCTYDKNLEMIQPLVEEIALFVFSVLAPWWPSQESDRTKIWSVRSGDLGIHMYKVSG
jgi:hypothetical protein